MIPTVDYLDTAHCGLVKGGTYVQTVLDWQSPISSLPTRITNKKIAPNILVSGFTRDYPTAYSKIPPTSKLGEGSSILLLCWLIGNELMLYLVRFELRLYVL
jgi:hypothetical protein